MLKVRTQKLTRGALRVGCILRVGFTKGGALNQLTVEEGWVEDTPKTKEEIKPNSSPERITYYEALL